MGWLRSAPIRLLFALALLISGLGSPVNATGIRPCYSKTISAASGASANVQMASANACGNSYIIYNLTTQEAFYKWGGDSNVAAIADGTDVASFSIPGNYYVVMDQTTGTAGGYIAARTPTGTTTLRIVQGKILP